MARPQRCKHGEVKAEKGGVGDVVEEEVERDSVGRVSKADAFFKRVELDLPEWLALKSVKTGR